MFSACLLAGAVGVAQAAPAAEAEPQFPAPFSSVDIGHIYWISIYISTWISIYISTQVPAPNCVTSNDILVTQTCTPRAEDVCNTQVSCDWWRAGHVTACSSLIGAPDHRDRGDRVRAAVQGRGGRAVRRPARPRPRPLLRQERGHGRGGG